MTQTSKDYEVIVRRRVPYLTTLLFRLFGGFFICLLVVEFIMLPAKNAPTEMALAYFNLVLPEVIKEFIAFSLIGTFVFCFLYIYVRIYRNAVLTFHTDQIKIIGKSMALAINVGTLKKVTFMDDSKEVGGKLKEKFTVYFDQRSEKSIRIKLKYYVQGEEFIGEFLRYEHINYEFLNIDFTPDFEKEI